MSDRLISASSDQRARTTLAAACLGMLTLGANGTAIMAALPTMRPALGLSAAELEWAINAYLIVSAACIIPGGKLCDRAGARRVCLIGLALFAVSAVVVATVQVPVALLAGRALQGLAAALSVPATLAAIHEANPPEHRPSAIGAWAGFLMLGFSLGPLIGGAFTHFIDWRIIFWASGVAMLVAAGGFVGASTRSGEPKGERFDWPGFVLLAVFMPALLSALQALPMLTSAPLNVLGFGTLAVAACIALVKLENRIADPLIDLALFRRSVFVRAVALGAIAMGSILSLLLYYNLDAQSPAGLGLTPVGAGLSLLPMSGGLLTFAFAAPGLVRRFCARRAMIGGTLLIAAGSLAIAGAVAWQEWATLPIGLFTIGIGLALPYATAPRLALATLPADAAGAGSGLINACTFLAGSIGVSAGAIMFAIAGLSGVMGLIGCLGLLGTVLCRGLPGTASR
jgi:MFS family permease